jgi:hypothetical protein
MRDVVGSGIMPPIRTADGRDAATGVSRAAGDGRDIEEE